MRTGLLIITFLVAGHFAAYTYVRPVLEEVSGARSEMVGVLLLVYRMACVVGNFVAGSYVARAESDSCRDRHGAGDFRDRAPDPGRIDAGRRTVGGVGLTYTGVSVSTLTWMVAAAPSFHEGVSALLARVFNAGIEVGALVGGLAADGAGITSVMWLGGALAAAGMLTSALDSAPVGRKRS
ncbi:hypothetical protein [Nocardia sp. NBC_00403]|uniref:hypothetical protein n=1 Tax=Nocardia sp. NBC_00403 TaxID=2975990 RepID=UPI002E1B2B23